MLKGQVLFYISSKGSARYRVTSKLILSVDCFLQNSKRLNYEVAFHECNRSWTQGTAGAGGPSLLPPVLGGAGPAPLLPQHLRTLGISAAGPGVGGLSWEMAPEGEVQQAAARHKLLPLPTPAGSSWSSHRVKPAPKHPLSPLWKMGRYGEEVNSSMLFALIHVKSFSLYFEKAVYIWSPCMKDKIRHFQLCHCMLCRKAQTLTKSHSKASSASEFFVCSPGFSCFTVTGSGKNFLWLIRF